MSKYIVSPCMLLLLVGCGTKIKHPVAEGASKDDPVSGVTMTCSSPYKLTQGCSVWSGATHEITLSGYAVSIAGSADGHVVLLMENMAKKFKEASKNDPEWSEMSNAAFNRARAVLEAAGIHILIARPVVSVGSIDGYLLELDGDGYSALNRASK